MTVISFHRTGKGVAPGLLYATLWPLYLAVILRWKRSVVRRSVDCRLFLMTALRSDFVGWCGSDV